MELPEKAVKPLLKTKVLIPLTGLKKHVFIVKVINVQLLMDNFV